MILNNDKYHNLRGTTLLADPFYNRGTAFSQKERESLGLLGLLPPRIETIEEQATRAYQQYQRHQNNFEKNLFLGQLHATNMTLFYYLVGKHLVEMLPIIYTPTVGESVKRFSKEFLRPQGLVIPISQRHQIDQILAEIDPDQLDIAVVTDGEGILGIGDWGVGGLNLAIGKLMVYTLCAGINPERTLPIQLDVGTNNEELLADPLYLGLRRPRASGKDYLEFIDEFVAVFKNRFPRSFLHWEDFGRDNARLVLDRYRLQLPSFNDDIQGTGAVAQAAVLSGIAKSGLTTQKHRFCIFGAGTAGCGIAYQIASALAKLEEKPLAEIRQRFYLVDRNGLLTDRLSDLLPFQRPYAIDSQRLHRWQISDINQISLSEVVKNAKPTVLIGCSAQSGAFSNEILAAMSQNCDRPIIMPLSNPTEKAEATPERILAISEGRALIATGSPFPPANWQKQRMTIAQCNNALVFPGIGLGMLISQAKSLNDQMLLAASQAVSCFIENQSTTRLLPDFTNILQISHEVALAVVKSAAESGTAAAQSETELLSALQKHTWQPQYD